MWGSIGFIVCSFASAFLVENLGLSVTPWLVGLLLFSFWPISRLLSDRQRKMPPYRSVLCLLKRPAVSVLLLLCAVAQLSHGAYYGFFSLYMYDHGYTTGAIGLLWALGVFAEVVVFIFVPAWLKRFGALSLFAASFLFSVLRWCLIAWWPTNLPVVIFAQTLHAATFGVYHVAAISLIDQWFPSGFQGRGHALYSGISFGIGGAIGIFIAGHLWSQWSGAQVFLLSAAVAALGFVAACYLYRFAGCGAARVLP